MRSDDLIERLDSIVSFPWEVLEYERWVQERIAEARGPADDYLFAAAVSRFIPDDADILAKVEDARVERGAGGALVRLPQGDAVPIAQASPKSVERVLVAIDGQLPLAALPSVAGVEYRELMAVLRALFGVVVFAPHAIAALEQELSGVEITRFPGAPYEIERPYWRNMAAVGRAIGSLDHLANELGTNESATRFLRRLHVLALMGESLTSYYKPASPISNKGVMPGAFLVGQARTLDTPQGTLFIDGPRANVGFVGGEVYHRALYAVLDDPEAAGPRHFVDSDGLDWGTTLRARAVSDAKAADWFCPPRPLTDAHLERLFSPLRSAIEVARIQRPNEVVRQLARFHYRFVHLHPFRCANQCVAMSLVNRLLRHSHGVGMPHLILDHLALRLSPVAYERVFCNAVAAYVLPKLSPVERYRELAARKARYYAFVEQLVAAGSVNAALGLVQQDLEAARLALFAA